MEKYLKILQSTGSKITKPRKRILQTILKFRKPFTISDIYQYCDDIDFTSVYRNIKLFYSLGILKLLDMSGKTLHYELAGIEHEQKVICIKCGRAELIDPNILKIIEKTTNFILTDHTIIFHGTCRTCQ